VSARAHRGLVARGQLVASGEGLWSSEEILELYLDAWTQSAHTRRTYRFAVLQLLTYLRRLRDPHLVAVRSWRDVTPVHLARFRAWLQRCPLERATVDCRLAAVRSFMRWCAVTGVSEIGEAQIAMALRFRGETGYRFRPAADDDALAAMFAVADFRDATILALIVGTGARTSEVARLRVGDLHLEEGVLSLYGKGGKHRIVPVRPELRDRLREWCRQEGIEGDPRAPIFTRSWTPPSGVRRPRDANREHLCLSPNRPYQVLCELARRAGVEHTTPRMVRHRYGRRTAKALGAPTAQQWMGHSSLNTTQIYLMEDALASLSASGLPPLPFELRAEP
jgi:integrase